MKNRTQKEIVQQIAMDYGNHLPADRIKYHAKRLYDVDVSTAVIVKAIGPYKTRVNLNQNVLLEMAQRLLISCNHDLYLASYVLKKAAAS